MIPRPATVNIGAATFTLEPTTTLAAVPELHGVGEWLRGALGPATGCWLPPVTAASSAGISLTVDSSLPEQGYALRVRPDGVLIAGGGAAGVFYGAQTLRQLLPAAALRRAPVGTGPWTLPTIEIEDAPRFAWRGCLLDVARHFQPVAEVLRFIDLLALHKLNVLHLHLTDDQGWRLPVPKWPRLTTIGSWRRASSVGPSRHGASDGRPHGGYYTADDIREIVAYAAQRHITVVPEIDLPGHTQAAIAAYPWLGNSAVRRQVWTEWGISPHVLNVSDRTLMFCRDVLDVVCDLFPSEVIGIGGDECPKDEWRASSAVRARLASLRLPDEEALQGWFMAQLIRHLAARGRRGYAWDDVLTGGVPQDTLIAAWRGPRATVDAARSGHQVIACPTDSTYLDYRQSNRSDEPIPVGPLLDLDGVYGFEPVPAELTDDEAARVIGVQAALWTEHLDSARALDYAAFPRLCAFAEVAWGKHRDDLADFAGRLDVHKGRLTALGVEYRPDGGPLPWQTRPDARGWPR